jgi:hypothetical protein
MRRLHKVTEGFTGRTIAELQNDNGDGCTSHEQARRELATIAGQQLAERLGDEDFDLVPGTWHVDDEGHELTAVYEARLAGVTEGKVTLTYVLAEGETFLT